VAEEEEEEEEEQGQACTQGSGCDGSDGGDDNDGRQPPAPAPAGVPSALAASNYALGSPWSRLQRNALATARRFTIEGG
jgi:hypothetical protein